MRHFFQVNNLQGGWLVVAGVVMLAAWVPLTGYSSLLGANVAVFLLSFCLASLAYLVSVWRLPKENPGLGVIWGCALAMRVVLLFTPVTLSEDVYRYIWDGHLIGQGINPYAEPVNSPLLDPYNTLLREKVNYPWLATPYLPAAQVYFALVEVITPQNPVGFQVGAVLLDLIAACLIQATLRRMQIPVKVVLIYLWNPLVVVEFAHGAHVDALMLVFLAASWWGLAQREKMGSTVSALSAAFAVLVKGLPLFFLPVYLKRWGLLRSTLFGFTVVAFLFFFAQGAGWGIAGAPDGRGLFGAVRIYTAEWEFNSGIYQWLAKLVTPGMSRVFSIIMPMMAGVLLGWLAFRTQVDDSSVAASLWFIRASALPYFLYLLLAPTVHPWYLALLIGWMPFFWNSSGEKFEIRLWIFPVIYWMVFETFTYLSYSGLSAPRGLNWIQLAAYLPLWVMLIWVVRMKGLGFLRLQKEKGK